ncbi:C-type lectin domain family 12 member A [Tenrec ecaudatus]|uniref:C-type lectin domain family 12 member A n=1 Tax=Tenrec ecaudatus TaxID=94439 RepID=UPI003F59E7EE
MSEEVTYADIKFQYSSKAENIQELGNLGNKVCRTLKIEMERWNSLQNQAEELQRNVSLQQMSSNNMSKELMIISTLLQNIITELCHEHVKKQEEHKCKPCPKTWKWHEDTCYGLFDAMETWENSEIKCSSHNASLLKIKSKSVLEFIKSMKLKTQFWLGLLPQEDQNIYIDLDEEIFSRDCCPVMPEEVTYATIKFPNDSKTETCQESYSLRRTDNQKRQELEPNGGTEIATKRTESSTEESESIGVRENPGTIKEEEPPNRTYSRSLTKVEEAEARGTKG